MSASQAIKSLSNIRKCLGIELSNSKIRSVSIAEFLHHTYTHNKFLIHFLLIDMLNPNIKPNIDLNL